VSWDQILSALAAICGTANVLTGRDVSDRFDGWPPSSPLGAACVVRPASTSEVAAILRHCNANGIGVVPQGGRTGISGGARASHEQVALSLERMHGIGPIDRANATITVEAGATLGAVQSAAAAEGLFYPVDIGARGTATIGGTIATNAGGNRVLRYGMTREQVLGLEAVLADGTVVSSMHAMLKNNAGYDIKHWFIGSEGTLGVITRAILRLRPQPRAAATAWMGVASFPQVTRLCELLVDHTDGALSSFEVMWPEFLDVTLRCGRHQNPLTSAHAFHVLVEIGARDASAILESGLAAAWDSGVIADAVIAQSEAQASALWAIREDSPARAAALKPAFHFDVSLPCSKMESYVEQVKAAISQGWPRSRVVAFGHVADGNLHINVGVGDGNSDTRKEVSRQVYGPLGSLGGSISAEHGIGIDKREYLHLTRTPAELHLMRLMKAQLDPGNTLNPAKVLP
jgi:FAD/FMN-containing dehydrogenase